MKEVVSELQRLIQIRHHREQTIHRKRNELHDVTGSVMGLTTHKTLEEYLLSEIWLLADQISGEVWMYRTAICPLHVRAD